MWWNILTVCNVAFVLLCHKDETSKPEKIEKAVSLFLVTLFGGDMENVSLKEILYQQFAKSTSKKQI